MLDFPSTQTPTLLLWLKKMGVFSQSDKDGENFRKMLVLDCWKKIDWQGERKGIFTAGFISRNLLCMIAAMSKWNPPSSFSKLYHPGIKVSIREKLVLNLSPFSPRCHYLPPQPLHYQYILKNTTNTSKELKILLCQLYTVILIDYGSD